MKNIDIYDIAVIGLGPAGSFFSMHIDKKFRTIALDKKQADLEHGFDKPCGGLLSPDAQKTLAKFSMTLPKEVLVSPQIFSVRTIDLDNSLTRYYQRHYINLDRRKFDRWLIDKIPANVDVQADSTCSEIIRDGEYYKITYIKENKTNIIYSKYIVGADGADSIVRRLVYGKQKMRKYLAIQQWFPDSHETPFYSCIFDSEITDSYAWGLTKDEYFIFGGAFDIESGKKDFEILKQKLAKHNFNLDNPIKTQACQVL